MISLIPGRRPIYPAILTAVLFLAVVSVATGQVTKMRTVSANILELPELGAVLTDSEDGPRVMEILPPEARLEKYREVDLRSSDLIVSVNGERTEKIATLRAIIEQAQPGDTIRLAFQRDSRFAVSAYTIGTADEVSEAEKMAMNFLADNPSAEGDGTVTRRIIKTPGEPSPDGITPWIELHVLLKDNEPGVEVVDVIEMPGIPAPIELMEGDVIISVQGEEVADGARLQEVFQAVAIGDNVDVVISRSGEEKQLSFVRPEPSPVRVIKK